MRRMIEGREEECEVRKGGRGERPKGEAENLQMRYEKAESAALLFG